MNILAKLHGEELQIETSASLGSNDKISIQLFDYSSSMGYIQIQFADKMVYYIEGCTVGNDNEFDKTPTISTDTTTIWKITKDGGTRILIWCNDQLVLTYLFGDSCPGKYSADVPAISFRNDDTASKRYKVVDQGQYKISINSNIYSILFQMLDNSYIVNKEKCRDNSRPTEEISANLHFRDVLAARRRNRYCRGILFYWREGTLF